MFIHKLQNILALVLTAVVLGGVGWSFGSQLHADPKLPLSKGAGPKANENPDKAPEVKAKQDPKQEDRITALRKERLETLRQQVRFLHARIQSGVDPLSTTLDANKKLMEAELVLCATKQQRIVVYEDAVKRFKMIDLLKSKELEAGMGRAFQAAEAKAARLEIEILLEQAKAER